MFSRNFKTSLSRFSKSPLYLVPAIRAAISKEYIIESSKIFGTLLLQIKYAKPSAIAVLPTPDSPTSKGLFLVLRERI